MQMLFNLTLNKLLFCVLGDNFVGMSLACFSFLITVMLIYGALMVCYGICYMS